jgi:nucleoside-diphosphate-sugar epimerase
MSGELVLVTGGSGFLGTHCILRLLDEGYRVRTTVRSLSREPDVRKMLEVGGANPGESLSFVVADLNSDSGWAEAIDGCEFVLHVASPFPANSPKHEDELIVPAREGTLRVLRFARDKGVKRVVLTSSFAAIGYNNKPQSQSYSEKDWTNLSNSRLRAYVKSKTLAERSAWDFINREGGTLELSVINPVAIFGPVLGPDYSTSIQMIRRLISGSIPGCPRLSYSIVDVRDVADLHVRAMANPAAKGDRFLAVAGESMTIQQIAYTLRSYMGKAAERVPTRILPDWILRCIALFDSSVAELVPQLGMVKNCTNEKSRSVLGWSPRSNEDAIIATAESLMQLGLLHKAV